MADGAVVTTVLDTGAGREGLVRRLVEVPPGSQHEGAAGPGGELWFVIAGAGRLSPGAGPASPVRPDTGVWLPPGAGYRVSADGPGRLRLDSVSLPAGTTEEAATAEGAATAAAGRAGAPGEATGPRLSELGDRPVEVTGDRRFRVLFGPGNGCSAATQFVGEIPPGRAPEHSHPYDEVVLVLEGEGVLHAGTGDRPLVPGSCVHLPPGEPHCLENTGRATLRVLGVFHPGGSPASKRQAPSS
jgi:mannose-6-phosphate isomerase-like protein (cupin superfamily)